MLRPEHAIRDHPAIRQIDILGKLHCNHLLVNLHNNPLKPITDPLTIAVVIAINFHNIPDFEARLPGEIYRRAGLFLGHHLARSPSALGATAYCTS